MLRGLRVCCLETKVSSRVWEGGCSADARMQPSSAWAQTHAPSRPHDTGRLFRFRRQYLRNKLIEVTQSLYKRLLQPLSPILYRMGDAHAHQEVSINYLVSFPVSLIFLIADQLINLRHYPENRQATSITILDAKPYL